MDREEQNRLILAELARLYPDARPALHFANPFELLVAVMLSAQCTDNQVNRVTPELFKQMRRPEDFVAASSAEIEKIVGAYANKWTAKQVAEIRAKHLPNLLAELAGA